MLSWFLNIIFCNATSPLIQLFSKHQNVCKRVKYLQQFLLLSFNVLTKSPVRHPPFIAHYIPFFSLLFEQTSKVFANPLHVMKSHKPIYSWLFRLIKTKLSLHTEKLYPDRRSCIMSSSGHSKSGQKMKTRQITNYPSLERRYELNVTTVKRMKERFIFDTLFYFDTSITVLSA